MKQELPGRIDLPTELRIIGDRMEPTIHVRIDQVDMSRTTTEVIYLLNKRWIPLKPGVSVVFDKEKD